MKKVMMLLTAVFCSTIVLTSCGSSSEAPQQTEGTEQTSDTEKQSDEKEVKKLGIKYSDIVRPEWLQLAMDRYKFQTVEDLYASIGFGGISVNKLMARLLDEYRKEHEEEDFEQKIEELAQARPKVQQIVSVIKERSLDE